MRKRKIVIGIAIALVCALLLAAGLYFVPIRTTIDASMQATKMDKDGNVIGTEEIILQCCLKKYLFKEDVFELSVAPFDDLKNWNFVSSGETSADFKTLFDKFYHSTGTASDITRGGMVWVTATMSQDFDYWVFCVTDNDNPIYYVASVNEHTPEEIVQYSKALPPDIKHLNYLITPAPLPFGSGVFCEAATCRTAQ